MRHSCTTCYLCVRFLPSPSYLGKLTVLVLLRSSLCPAKGGAGQDMSMITCWHPTLTCSTLPMPGHGLTPFQGFLPLPFPHSLPHGIPSCSSRSLVLP